MKEENPKLRLVNNRNLHKREATSLEQDAAVRITHTKQGSREELYQELDRELGTNLLYARSYRAIRRAVASGCGNKSAWITKSFLDICLGGVVMDESVEMIAAASRQLDEARKNLTKSSDDLAKLRDLIFPQLTEYVREIRAMRMNAVSEMSTILSEMRAVHKFFTEQNYEKEMAELERFVEVCKEVQKLKDTGILDVLLESAVRLSAKETKNEKA
jgi:hypothetical protein